MRRLLACVLMMTLLLTACGPRGETPEDAAFQIQRRYREMAGCSATVDLTAEYGDRVYDFTVDAVCRKDGETVLTVTAPELIAGITARLAEGETVLEYDGAALSLGELDGAGLTPVSAVTELLRQAASGYMAECSWADEEQTRLQALCRDPEAEENTGSEFLLVFDRDTQALLSAELSRDGVRVLTAQFSEFTFLEMTDDDTGDGTDLG